MTPRAVLLVLAPLVGCVARAPASRHDVPVVVFYDENGNGALDADEVVRLPGVRVELAGRVTTTVAGGRAVLTNMPAGRHSITVDTGSLPPFCAAGPPLAVEVGAGVEAAVPVTLPIGDNVPNTYMAFGDSITRGVGYSDDQSYRGQLESRLGAHFGRARVVDQGSPHGRSNQGAQRIATSLAAVRPAYTLVLYGTNDWNFPPCKQVDGCFTIRSLRRILDAVKQARSLPVLATIPPANQGFEHRSPPERNEWVAGINEEVRALAREEGALLVDLHAAFMARPSLRPLFTDHVHPSASGFELIADSFFAALTAARSPTR